jgi:hypothetical protein
MDNINIITKNIRLIPSYYINVVYLITKFHISFLGLYTASRITTPTPIFNTAVYFQVHIDQAVPHALNINGLLSKV